MSRFSLAYDGLEGYGTFYVQDKEESALSFVEFHHDPKNYVSVKELAHAAVHELNKMNGDE